MTRYEQKAMFEAVGEYDTLRAVVQRVCTALPAGVPKPRTLLFGSPAPARVVAMPTGDAKVHAFIRQVTQRDARRQQ